MIKGQQALARIGSSEVVFRFWGVTKILLALKFAEIELRVVRKEELITRCIDEVLRNLEPFAAAIVVSVFYCKDVLIFRSSDLVREDLVIDVIVERR